MVYSNCTVYQGTVERKQIGYTVCPRSRVQFLKVYPLYEHENDFSDIQHKRLIGHAVPLVLDRDGARWGPLDDRPLRFLPLSPVNQIAPL